jgi:hypothetical protein
VIDKEISIPQWFWTRCLITLWDVKTYLASRLVSISGNLAFCRLQTLKETLTDEQKQEICDALNSIAEEADELSLPLTQKGAKRIISNIREVTTDNINDIIGELSQRFDDEVEAVSFFLVRQDKLKYYNNPELAGAEFKANFPMANAELIEAGNCLALIRNTACVCHLMRATEYVLRSFERSLGIPPQPSGYYQNNTWGKILGRISEKRGHPGIRTTGQPHIPALPSSVEWLADPEFNESTYAFISAIKTPHRDRTFHVETTYDETGAENLFDVTVVALSHIAKKLKE